MRFKCREPVRTHVLQAIQQVYDYTMSEQGRKATEEETREKMEYIYRERSLGPEDEPDVHRATAMVIEADIYGSRMGDNFQGREELRAIKIEREAMALEATQYLWRQRKDRWRCLS